MTHAPYRVLHVFARMDKGGAESRIMDLYRYMDRSHIQFDFLSLEGGKHYFDEEIAQLGGRRFVVRHPRESLVGHMQDLYHLMKTKGPFQAVHAHTAHHEGAVALAARMAGIPHRVCHARTTGTARSASLHKRVGLLFGRLLIASCATRLLAISQAAGKYLYGEHVMKQGKVEIVPDAIDLSAYEQVNQIDPFVLRQQAGIPPCGILLGHIGSFRTVKNQTFLVRLLGNLRKTGIDARLVLIGSGDQRLEIERQVIEAGLAAYVHFLGVRDDIPRLVRMFDVFVMPSLYEGLGGAAIEAQAAGTACVLSSALPKEADMGLGTVRFVDLSEPMPFWMQAIFKQANAVRPSPDAIRAAFLERGFMLEHAADSIQRAYGLSGSSCAINDSGRMYEG
ncbi:glycosyltransferase family 1 protein [Paenibacillus agilis]|uniref:Glycosyltransferase family 1 protein n=1 Tax=Paenibacillus agilis TaxID=3020863 RepID=A0A559J134_9BACL|nr:glycosyltransferase family 1 protein [Paenibacillus agilis]TVX93605.1 glycosyltransferase family 1 protein [Paenibacillus agilis]